MSYQVITTPAGERLAVIPEAEYLAMVEAGESAADVAAVHRFRARMAAGEEELIPAAVVDRLLAGESPVRVWRQYRNMSARDLASSAGIGPPYLSEIETGKKEGSIGAMKAIAHALGVAIDDLV
ncbi:helix-turn-helix transcriptional regulator [Kaistia dalseonensis]|uniref:DNA-binding XRE family transcriptional regulator n=1 Tax=Kaistia dalseonensis TaxID=410840 RepID=A0ABU0H850_9HYPH|nr:helix-turn-helix transcriptional regulator [Kaistia dalseonensis]MCX5495364.1 helix-turn-helix transcriptional regulator [Kaistia dalseonensis]MDQ0437950.1 DNA-binding XRE family transcriptional regulator [Kaistia dalseonensis]